MPSSIALKNLSWSTPDGHRLFSNLDLAFSPGRTGLIGNNGTGKTSLLNIIAGVLPPAGGAVSRVGRVVMMRQLAQVPSGQTLAEIFGIDEALTHLSRIESGHPVDENPEPTGWTLEPRFHQAVARVGLSGIGPDKPLADLSGGEKTRALLAALLFEEPDVILLDEPTNNLDTDGRAAVTSILSGWRGAAIIASHDRTLLEQMDSIVELGNSGARIYGGNWSAYCTRRAIELQAEEHRRDVAERTVSEIDAKAQTRHERQQKRDGTGKRKRARRDQPKILLNAMRQRSEKTGGANARLAGRQREGAAREAAEARARIDILQTPSMSLNTTGLANGKTIAEAVNLTGGYPGADPVIREVSFSLVGPERVALSGANGSGKTTLFRLLTGTLQPMGGMARIHGSTAILDQHMSLLDPALSVRENYRLLNHDADENTCRAALARFLFRADAALQPVGTLSGGEILRAGLATVLGSPCPPQLLMLDEPTNHLDLRTIQALEAALIAYDGALLVISHDEAFLENIGVERTIRLTREDKAEE